MKFKLNDELWLSGKPMLVAGLLQAEAAGAKLVRYLLMPSGGAPQIVEETAGKFTLLRPFPPGTLPEASGSTVTVMGAKYTLGDVRKLKVVGQEGQVPGGQLKTPMLLSGMFSGPTGQLIREIAPGSPQQAFYSIKPISPADLLTAQEEAARKEAERQAAEQKASMAEEEEHEETGSGLGGLAKKAMGWGISILIVVALAFACSGSGSKDDDSSGSARTSLHVGGGHGGK